jgi:L-fuconolactonase
MGPVGDIGSAIVNLPVDADWLGEETEDVIAPDLPIIDAHHHLWDRPGSRYLPPDYLSDIGTGHRVIGTVYVENNGGYRSSGPLSLRPVGETEIMAAIADGWQDGTEAAAGMNLGIVGYADLLQGEDVAAVLQAHAAVGRGRFRGVRQVTAWTADPAAQVPQQGPRRAIGPGMLGDPRFRAGFACLGNAGLRFDAWLFHPQLPELAALARRFPETTIIVDHLGGPLRVGPYAGHRDEAHAEWLAHMTDLAACPNVVVKLGGLGQQLLGFAFRDRAGPAGSRELAGLWRPFVEPCIERFGAERCMFESNFPVDKAYFGYRTLWNAFKLLVTGASESERQALFSRTARQVYDLPC